jgi:hypothetical protein
VLTNLRDALQGVQQLQTGIQNAQSSFQQADNNNANNFGARKKK